MRREKCEPGSLHSRIPNPATPIARPQRLPSWTCKDQLFELSARHLFEQKISQEPWYRHVAFLIRLRRGVDESTIDV
jgi:hypothetical protein